MTPYLQIAGWALIHFVWQAAAIAGAASALLRLTRRRSASARYVIACASLVAMLAAPAVTARLMWTTMPSPADAASIGAVTETADAALKSRSPSGHDAALKGRAPSRGAGDRAAVAEGLSPAIERFLPGITLAWLTGVVLLLARMAGGWWHVRRLHRIALASPSSRWQTACRRLAYRLGLPAAAHVVESALVDVPTVIGWLRPAILLPIAALASLSPAQVEAILAHELAHIRRHDYAVNVLQTIAETLLFYHPAVWWLSNRIRAEREHCCDDIAVALCGDPVGYAQALAELEAWRAVPATTTTTIVMAATGGSLLGRVRRILQMPITDEPRSPSWAVTLALTMIFTAGAGTVQHLPSLSGQARAVTAWEPRTPPTPPTPPTPRTPPTPPTAPTPPTPVNGWAFDGPPAPSAPPAPPEPPAPPAPPAPLAPPAAPAAPAPAAPPAPSASHAPPAPIAYAGLPAPRAPSAPSAPLAPPSPAAPPTPSAHPAPPAPGASRGDWHLSWSDNGHKLDVRLRGTITFTDDLTDVQSLSDGGSLTLRGWSALVPHTVEITAANGSLTRTYYVAGLKKPWDAEARQFLAIELPVLVRQSGVGAEARVKSIFGRKGVSGVFEEIDLLRGDYARRLYFVALVDATHPDSAGVQPLLQRAGQLITSDYDRRQVLEHVAANVALDRKGAAAYVQAMATMRSDYDQREALTALTRRNRDVADGEPLLLALAHMKSSYDKRSVLEQILARGPIAAEGKKTVLTAAAGIQSDYDRRQVLSAYLKRFGVEPAVRDEFFAAVRAMTSDYDTAEVLLAAAPGVDAGSRPAFVTAAERIRSSHEQNRVLAALVKAERR